MHPIPNTGTADPTRLSQPGKAAYDINGALDRFHATEHTTFVDTKATDVACQIQRLCLQTPMGLGQRLREAREQAGLNQTELGEIAQVHRGVINAIEQRDSKSSRHAPQLADALGVNVRWLTTGQGEKYASETKSNPGFSQPQAAASIDPLIIEDILRILARYDRWPTPDELLDDARPMALTIADSYREIYQGTRDYSRRRTEEILSGQRADDDTRGTRSSWDTETGRAKS